VTELVLTAAPAAPAPEIRSVGVVGGGQMGRGIAQVFAVVIQIKRVPIW
jgi:ornithine cyclodeaminase/alanine dehydrogenase-like protein (mu-crystallin family)